MVSGGGFFFLEGFSADCSGAGAMGGSSISIFHTVETKVAMSFSDAVEVNR
jgi:hypothetical protein